MSRNDNSIAVEITEVSKRYGYLQALKSVSLEISASEFLVFSGHNGAGKTTLLKIIATHISPSSGTVKIFGAEAFKNGGETRRRIGLVTHESFLYDELTVRENLLFYAKLFGAGEEDFLATVDFLGLKRWYNVYVKQLSHGLRKRADIVRALIALRGVVAVAAVRQTPKWQVRHYGLSFSFQVSLCLPLRSRVKQTGERLAV